MKQYIWLNETERSLALSAQPSVSAVNFYRGRLPRDELRTRIGNLLATNAWLAGRLVLTPKLAVAYNEKPKQSALGIHFKYVDQNVLSTRDPYATICRHLETHKYLVPIGLSCISQNVPLFLVTVLYNVRLDESALVVSISHTLADGHAFYMLMESLDLTTLVPQFIVARPPGFYQEGLDLMGENLQWLTAAKGTFGILTRLATSVASKDPQKSFLKSVDSDWINSQKDLHSTAESWVSTNDILTSWCMTKEQKPFSVMIVDLRGRCKSAPMNLFGNFEAPLIFRDGDYESPKLIRKSLKTHQRMGNKHPGSPSWRQAANLDMNIVTNWSSFYYDLAFDRCQLICHYPIYLSHSPIFTATMVIFRPRKDKLAILGFSSTAVHDGPAIDFKQISA